MAALKEIAREERPFKKGDILTIQDDAIGVKYRVEVTDFRKVKNKDYYKLKLRRINEEDKDKRL